MHPLQRPWQNSHHGHLRRLHGNWKTESSKIRGMLKVQRKEIHLPGLQRNRQTPIGPAPQNLKFQILRSQILRSEIHKDAPEGLKARHMIAWAGASRASAGPG